MRSTNTGRGPSLAWAVGGLAVAGGGAAWTLWAVRRAAPVWHALAGVAVVCLSLAGVACYLFTATPRDRPAASDATDATYDNDDEPHEISRAMGIGSNPPTPPPPPRAAPTRSPDAAVDDDPAARYCPTCGARLIGNEDHCPYCGTRF